jgi:hypothetical protein
MGEKLNLAEDVTVRGFRTLWSWIGSCSANTELENLKEAIEKGKQAIGLAEISSEFLSIDPKIWHNLKDASEALEKVSEGIELAENICKDIKAIKRIHSAIKVLND